MAHEPDVVTKQEIVVTDEMIEAGRVFFEEWDEQVYLEAVPDKIPSFLKALFVEMRNISKE